MKPEASFSRHEWYGGAESAPRYIREHKRGFSNGLEIVMRSGEATLAQRRLLEPQHVKEVM